MINIDNTTIVYEHNIEEILENANQLYPFKENNLYLSAEETKSLSAEETKSPINLINMGSQDNFNKTPIHDLNFIQEQGIDLTLCPDFNSVEDRQTVENEV